MPERAHVTSLDALDSFRASLIVYLTKAKPTLEEVSNDVLRTRVWLENDQRTHWENQLRQRGKRLQEAEQALFSARLSNLREATDAEQMAVQRARRAFEEAENKLRRVKQWIREFDTRIEPLVKQLDHLRNLYTVDMPHAVATLAEIIKTLSDYAGLAPAPGGTGLSQPSAPPASGESSAAPEAASGGAS
jgi:chromosome segregation ATPase